MGLKIAYSELYSKFHLRIKEHFLRTFFLREHFGTFFADFALNFRIYISTKSHRKTLTCVISEHMDRIESIDGNDLKEVFGQASTHNLSKAEVSKAGQLAESTRKNGAKDMLSGSFRVNGKKYSDPECLLDHKNLIFKDELSLISWGKRNFQLVCWK